MDTQILSGISGPREPNKVINPEKDRKNFDTPKAPAEINPGKLDKEETVPDRSGIDHTKGHEPYEFKKTQKGNDRLGERLVGQGGYGSSEYRGGSTGSKKLSV